MTFERGNERIDRLRSDPLVTEAETEHTHTHTPTQYDIAKLQEALQAFTNGGIAWGQSMHPSKPVFLEVDGTLHPLQEIAASFHDGSFCLILRPHADPDPDR